MFVKTFYLVVITLYRLCIFYVNCVYTLCFYVCVNCDCILRICRKIASKNVLLNKRHGVPRRHCTERNTMPRCHTTFILSSRLFADHAYLLVCSLITRTTVCKLTQVYNIALLRRSMTVLPTRRRKLLSRVFTYRCHTKTILCLENRTHKRRHAKISGGPNLRHFRHKTMSK